MGQTKSGINAKWSITELAVARQELKGWVSHAGCFQETTGNHGTVERSAGEKS